jgi:hypothetical protein
MITLEAQALNINPDQMVIVTTVKTIHLLLKEAGVQLVVNYSDDRPSPLHSRPRHPLRHQDPFRLQPTRSPYHWGIYFIWLIIPATLDLKRRVACYFMVWLKKAKLVDVLVVGIVAPLLSLMIAGIHVARHLVRLVSLSVKSVAYGVSCKILSTSTTWIFSSLAICMTIPGRLYTNITWAIIHNIRHTAGDAARFISKENAA